MPASTVIRQTGRETGPLRHAFGKFVARVLGWTIVGGVPEPEKAIFIAAPHTTNWDGFYMQMVAWAMGVRLSWMTKHTLSFWPLGPVLRALGAVFVDRRANHDTVKSIAAQIRAADGIYLAIAPEGTRSWRPHWKSGFYTIAREAGVPIVMGFLDYKNKRGGCGPVLHLTGDIKADMDAIRAFYTPIEGLHPKNQGPILLQAELAAPPVQAEPPSPASASAPAAR